MRTTRFLIVTTLVCTALLPTTVAWSADAVSPPSSSSASSQPAITTPPPSTPAQPSAPAQQAPFPPGAPNAQQATVTPTAPVPEKPAAPPDPAHVPPPSVTVIDAVDAHGILGRDVRGSTDENMGRIADVIVDRSGQVRAAVIDFGGFLGVGTRKIVVDWGALHFSEVANKSQSISLALTREQVRAAPEYKDDQPIVVLGASGSLEPLRFPPLAQDK